MSSISELPASDPITSDAPLPTTSDQAPDPTTSAPEPTTSSADPTTSEPPPPPTTTTSDPVSPTASDVPTTTTVPPTSDQSPSDSAVPTTTNSVIPTTTNGGGDAVTTTVTTSTTSPSTTNNNNSDPSTTAAASSSTTTTTTQHARPTSSPVAMTTISSSNGHAVTITYTSYSVINPTPTSATDDSSSNSGSSNTGAIVGGVVGGVVGLALIAALAYFFLRKKKRSHRARENGDDLFSDVYPPMSSATVAANAVGTSSNSSNARPLVAPYRPASKVAGVDEDPYASYQQPIPSGPPTGYYEDYRYPGTQNPNSADYLPGQQYYSGGTSEQDYQSVGGRQWPEGSSDGGDRHVPNLVDDRTDVPHTRG